MVEDFSLASSLTRATTAPLTSSSTTSSTTAEAPAALSTITKDTAAALAHAMDMLDNGKVDKKTLDEVEYLARKYVAQGMDVNRAVARAQWDTVR